MLEEFTSMSSFETILQSEGPSVTLPNMLIYNGLEILQLDREGRHTSNPIALCDDAKCYSKLHVFQELTLEFLLGP